MLTRDLSPLFHEGAQNFEVFIYAFALSQPVARLAASQFPGREGGETGRSVCAHVVAVVPFLVGIEGALALDGLSSQDAVLPGCQKTAESRGRTERTLFRFAFRGQRPQGVQKVSPTVVQAADADRPDAVRSPARV